jgi:hypothetical protein
MRGGIGYADSSGSLPHITQFANCRKARRAAARFSDLRHFRWRTLTPSSLPSSRSSYRPKATIWTSRTKHRAIPETTFRKLIRGSKYLKCLWSTQPDPMGS